MPLTRKQQPKRRSWTFLRLALTVSISMAVEFSCTRLVQNEINENVAWFKPHEVHQTYASVPDSTIQAMLDLAAGMRDTLIVTDTVRDTLRFTVPDTVSVIVAQRALPDTVYVHADTLYIPVTVPRPETLRVVLHDTLTVQPPLPPKPWKSRGRP